MSQNKLTNMPWQTFGHDQVKSILEKQLENQQPAQAYLFMGPEGLGKKNLALEFAKMVLRTEKLENHPDFIFLAGEEGDIPVSKVRSLIAELSTKPFVASRKVVVVDNAQNLNASSSNALLKTLEEPSPTTVIILVASQKPLPTIVSRCQVFRFNPFSKKMLKEFSLAKKFQAGEKLVELSFGSPARLERFSRDPGFLEAENDSITRLAKLEKMPQGERLVSLPELAALEPGQLENVFFGWMMHKVGALRNEPTAPKVVSALQQAIFELKTNKNKKLILQGLFLKL